MGFWPRFFGRDLDARLAALHLRCLESQAKEAHADQADAAQRLCRLARRKLGDRSLWYAEGLLALSNAVLFPGRTKYGLTLSDKAEALFRDLVGPDHPHTLEVIRWRRLAAKLRGDRGQAEGLAARYIAGCEAIDPASPWDERAMGLLLGGAMGLMGNDDLAVAGPALRKYDEAATLHGRDRTPDAWGCVRALAKLHGALGEFDEADRLVRRSLEARRRESHRIEAARPGLKRAGVMYALANPLKDAVAIYLDLGRADLADPLIGELEETFREIRREAGKFGTPPTPWLSFDRGRVAWRLGRLDEAERAFRAAADIFREHKEANQDLRLDCLDHLGHLLAIRGDLDGAEGAFSEMFQLAHGRAEMQFTPRICLVFASMARFYAAAAAAPDAADPGDEEAAKRRARWLGNGASMEHEAAMRYLIIMGRKDLAPADGPKNMEALIADLRAKAEQARKKGDALLVANWSEIARLIETGTSPGREAAEAAPAAETRPASTEVAPDDPEADWDALARAIGQVSGSTDEAEAAPDSPGPTTEPGITIDHWTPPGGPSAATLTASWTPAQGGTTAAEEPEGPATWNVGDVIAGLYRADEIRGGGMGLVYRVRHLGWGVDLAVKSPRPAYFARPEHREAFTREAETWMGLGLHPNVATCFYVRTIGGVPRVFAEFVDGPSLAGAIRSGWLDDSGDGPGRRLDVAIQLARALDYAHERGLVHQDVKPANVLISGDGTVKLCDFGLARALASTGAGEDPSATYAGMTPAYCSPEQAARLPLGRKTDVWSFGATVLEMFLGRRAWDAGPDAARALREEADRPAIPPGLAEILGRCLAERVEDRASGMAEVEAALVAIHRDLTGRDYARAAPKAATALADSLNNRGISLIDLGRGPEAEAAFVEALGLRPGHLEATYNLGLLRWRAGSQADDDVLDQLAQASAGRARGDARLALLTALIHVERGDCASALEAIATAEGAGSDPEVAALRDFARAKLGESRSLLRADRIDDDMVSSACWAGPGDLVLVCSDPPALFDAADGRRVRDLGVARPDRPAIFAASDASGRRAVTCNREGYEVWDLATGRSIRRIASSKVYRSVGGGGCVLHPDGRHALLRDDEGGVSLIDLETGEVAVRLENSVDATMVMARLALSGDGTRAADCDMSKLVVWELPSGRQIGREQRDSIGPSVALDHDGRRVLTGGADCVALCWSVPMMLPVATCRGHRDAIFDLSFAPDGRRAVSAGADGTVRYWDVDRGRCLRTFSGARGAVRSAGIDAAGGRAVSAGEDGVLRIWGLAPEWSAPAPWQPCRSAAGDEASATDEGFAREVEAARGCLARDDATAALAHVEAARARPGCERRPEVVALGRDLANRLPRRDLREAWGGLRLGTIEGFVRGVDIAADGRTAVTGGDGGAVRLWDLASGECVRVLEGHRPGEIEIRGEGGQPKTMRTPPTAWCVSISPDGRRAASAGYQDRSVKVWDLEDGACLWTAESHRAQVLAVAFSPDGRLVVSGGADRGALLWEAETGRLLRFLNCPGSVVAARWSPDARLAYLLSVDHGVRAWDVGSGSVVARIEWPADAMSRLVPAGMLAMMMPDASQMAMAHDEQGYRARSGRPPTLNAFSFDVDAAGAHALIGTWTTPSIHRAAGGPPLRMFAGHEGVVAAVALSPDGRLALTGGKDQVVRLWDASTGACLRAFEGHNSEITCVRFSPDGTFALSGGFGEARQWLLDWELAPTPRFGWDEAARKHLEAFLSRRTPPTEDLPIDSAEPDPWEARQFLTRSGKPAWTGADLDGLMRRLGGVGLGWIGRDAIIDKLSYLNSSRA